MKKRTLVLGASNNPARVSYMALGRLNAAGHEVFALGSKAGRVGNIPIVTEAKNWKPIETVTIYLGAANQEQYYPYLIDLKPQRVIFNPGAENDELAALLEAEGIHTMEACTLVMLSTGQY